MQLPNRNLFHWDGLQLYLTETSNAVSLCTQYLQTLTKKELKISYMLSSFSSG